MISENETEKKSLIEEEVTTEKGIIIKKLSILDLSCEIL